jgi:hypothetical protein
MAIYDTIGATYTSTRRPDPRIAARIHAALGDAETVINIGAGTGSYEPPLSEYLPEAAAFDDARAIPLDRLAELLGATKTDVGYRLLVAEL